MRNNFKYVVISTLAIVFCGVRARGALCHAYDEDRVGVAQILSSRQLYANVTTDSIFLSRDGSTVLPWSSLDPATRLLGIAGGDLNLASTQVSALASAPMVGVSDLKSGKIIEVFDDRPRLLGPGSEWLSRNVFAWYYPLGIRVRYFAEGRVSNHLDVAFAAPLPHAHPMIAPDLSRVALVFPKTNKIVPLSISAEGAVQFSESIYADLESADAAEAAAAATSGAVKKALFSQDGTTLALVYGEGAATMVVAYRFDGSPPMSANFPNVDASAALVAISPDGARLAVANGRSVKIVDVREQRIVSRLERGAFGNGYAAKIAFSNAKTLVIVKDFGSALRWKYEP